MGIIRLYDSVRRKVRSAFYSHFFKSCGNGLVVDKDVTLTWCDHISLGEKVMINRGTLIQGNPFSHIYIGSHVTFAYESMILSAGHPIEIHPKEHIYKDVKIGDNVRVLAKALITSGVEIGRNAIVGAGAVVRNDVPPYAIVVGNPAKIIGFVATPDEIVDYEKTNYPMDDRLPADLLEKNYNKFFLKRLKEIKEYTKL